MQHYAKLWIYPIYFLKLMLVLNRWKNSCKTLRSKNKNTNKSRNKTKMLFDLFKWIFKCI